MMSAETVIVCDRCAGVIAQAHTAARARQDVRETGGRVALPGGRDLCHFCVQDEARSA